MTADAPLRVLIVDDEALGRQRIEDLLAKEHGVKIVGTAANGRDALEAIKQLRPDLLFLDVQMPGMTGLEVARALGVDNMPPTIFVTALDQHALQAFDLAALDYLVKPFDDERFEQAFRRARRVVSLEETQRLHERLLSVLQGNGTSAPLPGNVAATPANGINDAPRSGAGYLQRIAVESKGKIKYIPVDDIDYIAASGPYAEIIVGGRRSLLREAMQTLEERLDPSRFMRIHRSSIVQLDRVDSLLHAAGGDYEVQLRDGTKLRVSRNRREELEQRLETLDHKRGE
ncbi:MAG TPA: LytTR family DNA-binding domain-containing protein [Gemmatimonadaceae bacterium]|jgi:two-component system LytT family response regulator